MGFKKGNQNIDSVFYGTDYVERMYLGKKQFFQASYLDFYKTNFFSIGLGQKKQINRSGAISLIKTEWSPQYGYQLEIKQDKEDDKDFVDYKYDIFRDNFSFILPRGKYLANVRLKNISSSTGTLYCKLLKKGETSSQDVDLTSDPFYDGFYHEKAQEVYVDKDTEVYLGMYTKNLNPGQTSIFSLELFPATGETGKFEELPSLMVRGRKKEIYNSGASSINITIPATAFYEGVSYPVQYIDSDAFNYEVTENGTTVSQPLTKISTITVEGDNMIGFGNRAFQNCSSCTSFSCTSSVFQGGLFANNAAFEGCEALNSLTLSIVKNINGLRESQNLKSIVMGGRGSYSFDNSFAGNTSIETIHWKNKDSFGAEKAFRASFGPASFEGCTQLTTIVSNDANSILGEDTIFSVGSIAFAGCTSLIVAGTGFGPNTGPLYSYIGAEAFSGCTGLTSVDFGTREGAKTKINLQAFKNCTGITSINLPSTVTYIGFEAFSGCTGLTSVDFGTREGAETKIDSGVFENCTGLTSINLPNTVTSIGSEAFSGCSSLETINIPFIGESATSTNNKFSYIFGTVPTSLKTVGFSQGNNITKIPDYAFENCSNITSINNNDTENIVSIGQYAYSGTGITSIRLSPVLTDVGQGAFSGCTGLTNVDFGTKAGANTRIGSQAFENCTGLTSINLPITVSSIGSEAFSGCSSLGSINIPFIGESATSTNNKFSYIFGTVPTSLKTVGFSQGNNITKIPNYAFRYCSSLTSITIPNSVTSIGEEAFRDCSGLTSINIPNSVTSIGVNAFSGCSSLTNITIPDSVTVIVLGAFSRCSSLTSINIPNSVTSIGKYAFNGCSSLTSATIGNGVTSIGEDAFSGCGSLTSLTTPADFLSSFDKTNLRNVTVTKGNIPNNAFNNCTSLTTVILKDGVTSIGVTAFNGCSGLTSITIPDSVTSIGASAFGGCSGLTSITIPDSVTSIGATAFIDCRSLKSINIPNGVTSIGRGAFEGCSSLETINIPFIGESATSTNNKFSYIFGTVPTSLKTVGFSQGNNITKIPDYAFQDCSNITSINGNDTGNIVSIGTSAYSGTGITSIRLSSALTNVGSSAFSGCTGLTSVRFEKTNNYVTRKIGPSAFDNCVNLTGVEVPGGFSATEDDHGIPWFSLEAAKNWELNDFANVTSNPLYYAKNLKTQNVINNTSSTSEDYIKANYFKNFPSLSIKSFCYIGLTGIQLKINSVAQIGTKAFWGSSFEELHLSFVGIQDETGTLISKAQILSNAFQNTTVTNSVDLDTNVFILFYKDAFKNFNISTTQKYFKFIPGEMDWGSLCYFANEGANPIGQNGVTLVEPAPLEGQVFTIREAWINTIKQDTAISQHIELDKWGYQYCNNLNITSLSIDRNKNETETWQVPCGFCSGCSNLGNFPTKQFLEWCDKVNDYGFYNCSKLSFAISKSRLFVGDGGFYNTGVTDISLIQPTGRDVAIGKRAFANCSSLKSLNISNPYSVDEEKPAIGDEAFAECANLSSVIITQSSFDYKVTIGSGIFKNCNKLEYIKIPSFVAYSYRLTEEKWKSTIFNLFNTNPSSYVLVPEIGAYSCIFGERYTLFLPHSLKEFISTSAINYSLDYTRIGYTLYNNNDGSSPALLFQQGQGKTTVTNSASSYSEKAFKNNNGSITVK